MYLKWAEKLIWHRSFSKRNLVNRKLLNRILAPNAGKQNALEEENSSQNQSRVVQEAYILNLPEQLLIETLLYLDPSDLPSFTGVCKEWEFSIQTNEFLWHAWFIRRWPSLWKRKKSKHYSSPAAYNPYTISFPSSPLPLSPKTGAKGPTLAAAPAAAAVAGAELRFLPELEGEALVYADHEDSWRKSYRNRIMYVDSWSSCLQPPLSRVNSRNNSPVRQHGASTSANVSINSNHSGYGSMTSPVSADGNNSFGRFSVTNPPLSPPTHSSRSHARSIPISVGNRRNRYFPL